MDRPSRAARRRRLPTILTIVLGAAAALVPSAAAASPSAAGPFGDVAALKADFLRDSAARDGRFYDAGSVEHLAFDRAGRKVDVVVPRDYTIGSVDVTENARAGTVTAAVTGNAGGEALVYPEGPGFATFSSWSSGSYRLQLTGMGTMDSYWYKLKDTGERNASYDWWGYRRKAVAVPKDRSGLPDYRVERMGMRSYPNAATRGILRGWTEWGPSQGEIEGDCNSSPFQINLAGGAIGMSFRDCENYRIDRKSADADAGDMSVNWKNGDFWPTGGPQEMGTAVIVRTAQGKVPVYNDYQYVEFIHPSADLPGNDPSWDCATTNASKTCR